MPLIQALNSVRFSAKSSAGNPAQRKAYESQQKVPVDFVCTVLGITDKDKLGGVAKRILVFLCAGQKTLAKYHRDKEAEAVNTELLGLFDGNKAKANIFLDGIKNNKEAQAKFETEATKYLPK